MKIATTKSGNFIVPPSSRRANAKAFLDQVPGDSSPAGEQFHAGRHMIQFENGGEDGLPLLLQISEGRANEDLVTLVHQASVSVVLIVGHNYCILNRVAQ